MATNEQIADLVSLYVGYFDRVPDPEGLQFWIDQIDNGREYGTIAADFAGSIEARSLYPFLENAVDVSPDTFVTTVYQNLFNREPDAEGQAFWVGVLAGGTIPVGDMIESIINGAIDAPTADVPTFDSQVLGNKGIVGLHFVTQTYAYDNVNYEIRDLSDLLAPVTSEPVSVIIAQQNTDALLEQFEPVEIMTGFALTTDADFFSQSEGLIDNSTTFDGTMIENSLQSIDDINAGSGIDVLNATLNTAGTVMPTLASVENIFIEAINGSSTLDLSNATGVSQIWNNGSTAGLTFQGMDLSTVAGFTGGTISGDTTFDYADTNGSNDTATLVLDARTLIRSDVVMIDGVENVTILIDSATQNTALTRFVADDATDIRVIGEANAFDFIGNSASDVRSIEAFDASGFTGRLNVNFDYGPAQPSEEKASNELTITGSADGGDVIRLTRLHTDDIIIFNETATSTIADRTDVIHFNYNDFGRRDDEADKIDISAFELSGVSALGTVDFDPTSDVAGFFSSAGSAIVQSSNRSDWFYVDSNNNGDFDAETDLAIEVSGVTSVDDFILG